MIWIEVTDTEGAKHLVNLNNIVEIQYFDNTDMTMIVCSKIGQSPIYINGNKINAIKRTLNTGEHYVTKIGD